MVMNLKNFFFQVADIYKFIARFLREAVFPPYEGREIVRQCFAMGNKSWFLITFTAFIAGIVFTKQSRPSLASFGAESWLPSLVSQAVVRSLGPLDNRVDLCRKIRIQYWG